MNKSVPLQFHNYIDYAKKSIAGKFNLRLEELDSFQRNNRLPEEFWLLAKVAVNNYELQIRSVEEKTKIKKQDKTEQFIQKKINEFSSFLDKLEQSGRVSKGTRKSLEIVMRYFIGTGQTNKKKSHLILSHPKYDITILTETMMDGLINTLQKSKVYASKVTHHFLALCLPNEMIPVDSESIRTAYLRSIRKYQKSQ